LRTVSVPSGPHASVANRSIFSSVQAMTLPVPIVTPLCNL
jgi:hypothetical protein